MTPALADRLTAPRTCLAGHLMQHCRSDRPTLIAPARLATSSSGKRMADDVRICLTQKFQQQERPADEIAPASSDSFVRQECLADGTRTCRASHILHYCSSDRLAGIRTCRSIQLPWQGRLARATFLRGTCTTIDGRSAMWKS
jgi:hypothetical protein